MSFIIICLHFHPQIHAFLISSPPFSLRLFLLHQPLWLLGYFLNMSGTHLPHGLWAAAWNSLPLQVTWLSPLPSTNLDSGPFSPQWGCSLLLFNHYNSHPTPGTLSPLPSFIFHHSIYRIHRHYIFHLCIYYPAPQLEC